MSHSVQMPALGESVTEGTVTRWLKNEGDQVTEDEPLLEVSTDKVDTEVPAPYSGVLERILVQEDETVAVGAELAIIGDGSGGGSAGQAAQDTSGAGQQAQAEQAEQQPEQAEQQPEQAEQQPEQAEQPPAAAQPAPAQQPAAGGGSGGEASGAPSGSEVTMPAMGESVTEGTVTRWLKQVGDAVAVDEPLLEISTDKVDTEMPSPVGGTLLKILVQEDETVEVGAPLAIIGSAEGAAAPARQPEAGQQPEQAPQPQAQPERRAAPQPQPAAAERAEPEPQPQPEPQPEPEQEPEQEPQAAPQTPPGAKSAPEPAAQPRTAPAAAATATSAAATQAAPSAPPRPSAPAWQPPAGPRGGAYVTPVVRKLAADAGVDLTSVTGTGVGGRIRREDVLAAAEQQQAAAAAPAGGPSVGASAAAGAPVRPDAAAAALIGTTQKTPRIRQSIARNMLTAVTTSAQLTTVTEVDVTRVASLRQRAKASFEAREGVKLSFLPFFVKAAVEAAKAYPIINSSLSEDLSEITYHPAVNMGIAVDTPRGLIVPVIHNADDLNIGGLARRISDLAARTRESRIGPDELSGGTLTVTNTGSVGALFDTAIFVPPQSAILVTGAVVKRPVVVTDAEGDDVIAVRSMAYVALSYDHRIIDGADAARYLAAVKKRIEGGDFEADLGL